MKTKWVLPVLLSMSVLVASCGKDNESGKNGGQYFGAVGTYSGVGPANTNNPYVAQIFQVLPCMTQGYGLPQGYSVNQRIGTGTRMNFKVASMATHVGVSAEGDVAVLTGDAQGNAVLSLYLCPRGSTRAGASMNQNPAFGVTTAGCRVNPITAANVFIQSYYGNLPIAFFAIDVIGSPGLPQLPQQFYQLKQNLCF